jgi:23S rRNA (adenine2503-C2)-methyltransferase
VPLRHARSEPVAVLGLDKTGASGAEDVADARTKAGAYGLHPDDITQLSPPNSPAYIFGKLQRVHAHKDGMPDVAPKLLAFLRERLSFSLPRIDGMVRSDDHATKLTLVLDDGLRVEAVHMPRQTKSPRTTLCISSQAGCAMGCTFCATAKMGLVRNLTAHEIVGQVLAVLAALGPLEYGRVNLVFMGMGEPLHNVEEVRAAVRVLSDPRGLGIALSRITLSTAGWLPGLVALADDPYRPNLALSMNATTDLARTRIMPVARRWSLAELREQLARIKLRPHEKLLISYVLLAGENDTDDDARRLAAFASGLRAIVNVIPWNPVDGATHAESPRAADFAKLLHELGALCTVRRNRGRDANAACGQLVQQESRKKRRLPVSVP